MSANREELKTIVKEVLTEMLAPLLLVQESSEQWVDLKKAWRPLGFPSYASLYKTVQSGLLREGKELCDRRKPGAQIARWQVDLIAARERLRQNPAKRRGV